MFPDETHSGALPAPRADRGVGRYATWGTRELILCAVVVLILYAALPLAIYLPVAAATSTDSQETRFAQSVGAVLWDVAMLFVVYWFARKTGGSWRDLGFRQPGRERWPTPKLIGFVGMCYLAAIGAVQIYSLLINLLGLHWLEPGQQIPDDFFDNGYVVAMIGFAVVFAAPIAEEVFFRGFLFAGLRSRWRFLLAALVSGVIFSLAHVDPGLIIPFTLVGIVLAYAYERADSLFASIGVHFLFNCISFALLLLVPEARNQ